MDQLYYITIDPGFTPEQLAAANAINERIAAYFLSNAEYYVTVGNMLTTKRTPFLRLAKHMRLLPEMTAGVEEAGLNFTGQAIAQGRVLTAWGQELADTEAQLLADVAAFNAA